MGPNAEPSLQGLRVLSLESRRAREIGALIRRYGGVPIIAPSMREIPLSQNSAALDFVRQAEAGKIDCAIFLTGVGMRALVESVAGEYSREGLAAALDKTVLVARGPKPAAALKELGLQPFLTAREPNTWREILSDLDSGYPVQGKKVAVQEYGVANREFLKALEARGAEILRVPVYRWALPEDLAPLSSAVRDITDGKVDIALFTNATQALHLFQLGAADGLEQPLRQALKRVVIASIGPVCSEALDDLGVKVDLEPDHPRMGHLMAEVARRGRDLVARKRR